MWTFLFLLWGMNAGYIHDIPPMYHFVYQITAHKVEFDWLIENHGGNPYKCVYLRLYTDTYRIFTSKYEILYFDDECNRASYFMMCAFLLPTNDTNLYLPPTFTPDNSTWLDNTVVCPKGHRTLKYLQCLKSADCFDERDIQSQERSDCVQDKMGGEGCNGLDRRFECSIGTNKIPFSMVSQFS